MFGPTTIRRSLLRNMVWLILVTSGAILIVTYFVGARRTARELSHTLIQVATEWTVAELEKSFGPVTRNLLVVREWGRVGMLDVSGDSREFNALLMPILEQFPQISSVNLANTKGFGHLLLHDRETGTWRNRVVRADRWGEKALWRRWRDVDNLIDESWKELDYDPRSAQWFQGAINPDAGGGIHWTEPYIFHTTRDPGITVSASWKAPTDDITTYVIAFDVLLIDIAIFTTGLYVSEHGTAVVLTESGAVIGLPRDERFQSISEIKTAVLSSAEELGIPALAGAVRTWKEMKVKSPDSFRFRSEGDHWWAGFRPFDLGR